VVLALPADVLAGVHELAGRLAVPEKSVFLSAHLAALGTLVGSRDIVTGVATNGRPEIEGADRVLGLYLNCVPLRARLIGSWAELIRSVFGREREHWPHRRYPLAELTAQLRRPPFEAVFNYTRFHPLSTVNQLGELQVLDWWFSDRTDFPLAVDVNRQPGRVAPATELFVRAGDGVTPEVAAEFADAMVRTLTTLITAPDTDVPPPLSI
jgi:non-ribosomal peptide synthetase component F